MNKYEATGSNTLSEMLQKEVSAPIKTVDIPVQLREYFKKTRNLFSSSLFPPSHSSQWRGSIQGTSKNQNYIASDINNWMVILPKYIPIIKLP